MISAPLVLSWRDGYAGLYRARYQRLAAVTRTLIACYPAIADNMTGHCNIAPDDRKTDPGLPLTGFRALVALSSRTRNDMTLFATLLVR